MEKKKKSTKPKKKTTRKTTKTKKASKILKDAPENKYFVFCDGHPVRNVTQLAEKLENIQEEVFNHHVTENRNDFVNWVKDVFEEVELAEEIAGLKNKDHIRLAIYKHIVKKTPKKK
ncbi:hypothetical protein KO361_03740 [Candidatus Woesearchaeota archaeon]|nr:hypothetical protein [Candidatus Woesearchaeota archaeon]